MDPDNVKRSPSRKGGRLIVALVLVAWGGPALAWCLYALSRTSDMRIRNEEPIVRLEVEEPGAGESRRGIVENPEALSAFRQALMKAVDHSPNHPWKERVLTAKVVRAGGEELYEVFLDQRGADYDYLRFIARSGSTTFYGAAFRVPALRGAVLDAMRTH